MEIRVRMPRVRKEEWRVKRAVEGDDCRAFVDGGGGITPPPTVVSGSKLTAGVVDLR